MVANLRFLAFSTACFLVAGAASGQAAVVSVKCSSTKTIQAAINAAAAGVSTTINATGSCLGNIAMPRGKLIIIAGTLGGTQITPKDATLPALISYGDTSVQNVNIQNLSGAAEALVEAEVGGVLQLIGDNLSGPLTDSVVGIWDNSTAVIVNTDISDGATDSIDLANAWSLVLRATSALPNGPHLSQSIISGQVFCGQGSSLFIRVKSGGQVAINSPNTAAIYGSQCALSLVNKTGDANNFTITSGAGNGIQLDKSTLQVVRGTIANNLGSGIRALASSASVSGSVIANNGAADLYAGPGSTLFFNTTNAASSIPGAYAGNTLQCWPSTDPHAQIFYGDGSLDGVVDPSNNVCAVNAPTLPQ